MERTDPKFRLVRCPKCLNLIAESADIPVYQCGGCGAVLRAKYHIPSAENVTSGSFENNSKNPSDTSSLNNGLNSSGNQMTASTSEVDNGVELATPSNFPETNAVSNSDEKGESSEHGERDIEERGPDHDSPRHTVSLALESDTNLKNEEREKSLKLSPQGHDSLRPIDDMEESAEPIRQSVASEVEMVDGGFDDIQGNILGSTTSSSHAYDGSASSAEDGCSDRDPQRFLRLSKRTFRHKKILDSIDNKGTKAGEDGLADNVVTIDVGSPLQARIPPAKSQNENYTSAPMVKSDSNRDKLLSPEQETPIDSEDFHSVRNWMVPEDDEPSRSQPRELVVRGDSLDCQNDNPSTNKSRYLEPNHMKILKKVDELRDELSELFDQTVEGKRTTNLRGVREEDPTQGLDSNLCRRPGNYLPRKDVPQRFQYSHAPFTGQPHCSCLHCRKPQTPDRKMEGLDHKERRQSVKRHCRPIAGGAPFVVCCECLKLLQVPADFLVSRRRLHQLQCGACSKVLLYSFRARALKIPSTPTEVRHPPSEVEHSTDANTGHETSSSHFDDCPRGHPFSYSEEFGLSFTKSDSPEIESVLNVSRNSSDVMEERKGKQVKATQFHRLLGYSSASEILYRPGDVDDGYRSAEPTPPHFRRPSVEGDTGYGPKALVIRTPRHEHSEAGTSSNPVERHEDDESPKRTRRGGPPLRGLLKKGIRELNHGLENVKQKIHANGKIIPTR